MKQKQFKIEQPFNLELGEKLPEVVISYATAGTLNKTKDNVVWVFHALTANENPFEWWPGLVGKEDYFNPSEYFIVCANVLGSCYGTTGPNSNSLPIEFQGLGFPQITVKDINKLHQKLAKHLGINRVKYAIGGSFGGYQAFEFALGHVKVENLIVIASSATESPWNIAIHETQRMAIKCDHTLSHTKGGTRGLEAARGIGLLTYRTPQSYIDGQPRQPEQVSDFSASSYINYQGQKLSKRFTAHSYLTLLNCLDTHDLSRGYTSKKEALSSITSNTLCIGIAEDILATPEVLKEDCSLIPKGHFELIHSKFGHDGFLIETEKLTQVIDRYFNYKN